MSFRVCIIGCGDHSRVAHGPSLRRYAETCSDVDLAGCCDKDPSKADSYRSEFGFRRSYTDLGKMLDVEKPDAVYLIVQPETTPRLAHGIFERGIPLLMEKPPAMTEAEVLRLIEVAERRRVPHLVAFNRRFLPLVAELAKSLRAVGDIRDVQLISYDMIRVERREQEFAGTAVHAVDAISFIAGSPYRELEIRYRDLPTAGRGVASILLDGIMESGARCHLQVCPVAGAVLERASVHLEGHSFYCDMPIWDGADRPGRLLHFDNGNVAADVRGDSLVPGGELFVTNGFYAETVAFLDGVRSGRMPGADLSSSLQPVQIMECMGRHDAFYRR